MGATPERRGGWRCTSPSAPMPIEACREGGSLPATASMAGSASTLRRPWYNRKRASDIRNRMRVHRRRDFVSGDPPSAMDTRGSASARASGAQNGSPGIRADRHTVYPSIIASEGAVGSAARSSASRTRQPWRLPYRPVTLLSLPRIPCSIRSISRRISRPVADPFARPGDRFGSAQLPRTFSARSNSPSVRTTATASTVQPCSWSPSQSSRWTRPQEWSPVAVSWPGST